MSNLTIRRLLGSRPLALAWRAIAVAALTIVLFQCQLGIGQAQEKEQVQLIQLYVDAAGDLAVYPERLIVGPNTQIVIGTLDPEGESAYELLKDQVFLFTTPKADMVFFDEPTYPWGKADSAGPPLTDKKTKKLHIGNKTDVAEKDEVFRELVSVHVKGVDELDIERPIVVPYTLLYKKGDDPWYAVKGSEVEIDPNRSKRR